MYFQQSQCQRDMCLYMELWPLKFPASLPGLRDREVHSLDRPKPWGSLRSHNQGLGVLHQPAELQQLRTACSKCTVCAQEIGNLCGPFYWLAKRKKFLILYWLLQTLLCFQSCAVLMKFKVTGCPGCHLAHSDQPHFLLSSTTHSSSSPHSSRH